MRNDNYSSSKIAHAHRVTNDHWKRSFKLAPYEREAMKLIFQKIKTSCKNLLQWFVTKVIFFISLASKNSTTKPNNKLQ